MPIELPPGTIKVAPFGLNDKWEPLNSQIVAQWNKSPGQYAIKTREDRHERTCCAWRRVFFEYKTDSQGNVGIGFINLNWFQRVIRLLFGWAGAYSNTIFTKDSLNRIWAAVKLAASFEPIYSTVSTPHLMDHQHRQGWDVGYQWPAIVREVESGKFYFLGYYPSKEAVEHAQNRSVRKFQARNTQINKMATKQHTMEEASSFADKHLSVGFAEFMHYDNPYAT